MRIMICGIDEAGRGPVMGPLVVAGVKLKDETPLVEMKVRDSKKLSAKKREFLAEQIRKCAEIEVFVLTAYELDVLRQVATLNEIEANLFTKIIESLKPDKVYVDCVDTSEENFQKNLLSKLNYRPELVSRHGADDIYPVVSAASIIAKTVRDREILRISSELKSDFGSGYPSDQVTIEFIKNWLESNGRFPPHTRYSWKTTSRLLEDHKFKPTKLDDF